MGGQVDPKTPSQDAQQVPAATDYEHPKIVSISRKKSSLQLAGKAAPTNSAHSGGRADFVAYPGCVKPWEWAKGFGHYSPNKPRSLQKDDPVITEILEACKGVQKPKTVVFAMGFNFKPEYDSSAKTYGSGPSGTHLRIHEDTIKLLKQNSIGCEYVNTYNANVTNGQGDLAMSTYAKYVNKGHWTAIICHCTC